jgi:hypothetical protein
VSRPVGTEHTKRLNILEAVIAVALSHKQPIFYFGPLVAISDVTMHSLFLTYIWNSTFGS